METLNVDRVHIAGRDGREIPVFGNRVARKYLNRGASYRADGQAGVAVVDARHSGVEVGQQIWLLFKELAAIVVVHAAVDFTPDAEKGRGLPNNVNIRRHKHRRTIGNVAGLNVKVNAETELELIDSKAITRQDMKYSFIIGKGGIIEAETEVEIDCRLRGSAPVSGTAKCNAVIVGVVLSKINH